jgi:hypothetical protein
MWDDASQNRRTREHTYRLKLMDQDTLPGGGLSVCACLKSSYLPVIDSTEQTYLKTLAIESLMLSRLATEAPTDLSPLSVYG